MKGDYNTNQLLFSLVNGFFFFPLFFLWVPALYFSLQNEGRIAKQFNIACLVVGNSFLIICFLPFTFKTNNVFSSNFRNRVYNYMDCNSSSILQLFYIYIFRK